MRMGLIAAIAVVGLGLPRRRNQAPVLLDEDAELVARLRAGEEQAFVALVARHHAAMVRLAGSYVASQAIAEEVVQDTWMGVLRGMDGFAGRSSFKTWLLQILVNRARSTGVREHRSTAVGDAVKTNVNRKHLTRVLQAFFERAVAVRRSSA